MVYRYSTRLMKRIKGVRGGTVTYEQERDGLEMKSTR